VDNHNAPSKNSNYYASKYILIFFAKDYTSCHRFLTF